MWLPAAVDQSPVDACKSSGVRCFASPCAGRQCESHPGAQCVADYCYGCNYYFKDPATGVRIDECPHSCSPTTF